ncbi:MAG TPA: hypothetical protein VEK15_00095, partial [Vicinamibacteria bacterium]|nr:hypothetical protein [Vicinamibacteria bacterium]
MKHVIVALHLLVASGTFGFSYTEKQVQSKDTEIKGWVEIHTPINDDFRRAFEARTSGDLTAWV